MYFILNCGMNILCDNMSAVSYLETDISVHSKMLSVLSDAVVYMHFFINIVPQ